MEESFGVGAFRSRTQVLRMESALRRAGIPVQVVSTPRDVAIGCGLSVRFPLADWERVRSVYQATRPGALIGFYRIDRDGRDHSSLLPLEL
jgi:hypothetical protein